MTADSAGTLPRLPAGIDLQDARLIDRAQRSIPTTERPFADLAAELGLTEAMVIERLGHLLATGVLTRLGPLYQIERAGGQFILARCRRRKTAMPKSRRRSTPCPRWRTTTGASTRSTCGS